MSTFEQYAQARRSGLGRDYYGGSGMSTSEKIAWGILLFLAFAAAGYVYHTWMTGRMERAAADRLYRETVERVIRANYDEPLLPGQKRVLCVTDRGKTRCEELASRIPLD